MQTLVRARHANLSVGKVSTGKKGIQDTRNKPHPMYISIEKLLSNRFAIQLLESTPHTRQINIKCSPSEESESWKWMERWTSVSSPQVMEPNKSTREQDKIDVTKNQDGNVILEQKSDIIFDESKPPSVPEKPTMEAEQPKRSSKRVATEEADSDGRKSVFGSRKASNPSFIAAHSRFEELTSKKDTLTSVSLDSPANSIQTRNVEPAESFVYESLKVGRTGGSECGTELSVTSMLDSPDPSEAGNVEYEKETRDLDKEAGDSKSISVEEHDLLGTELTHSIMALSDKYDGNTFAGSEQLQPDNGDTVRVKQSSEDNTSDGQKKLEIGIKHEVDKSSPAASPRTPYNNLSNNNKSKTEKKSSSQKAKSKSNSNSKKSPVSSNLGSGLRNSLDHLPRESKPSKRRNSFGSQSSDHIDMEPRDSSSSNSIPSYMQVTESARAKALANNSPRSSPDVQGKEAYLKKRHSLPGANGRHGSPHIKRTSPQAQQTAKGTDKGERKWQR
ncbi:IQ motif, EF-hand binding site, P-loop containing nucleoside triphosphate hydrolase [Artemisia annua]|nr:IQ motif, EF-hand binding site, P-loop containing nucleoside triphosphate hydrolase [Artemisia annua]